MKKNVQCIKYIQFGGLRKARLKFPEQKKTFYNTKYTKLTHKQARQDSVQ